ncbi:MAG: putative phosphate transport protein (TIGR00153 family) [Halieaceae bacterium]|jgi:predicted phosphate transport protein (TIGR00153 family)
MSSPLGKLFGRSPIAPIQQHMQIAEETVQLLCGLLTASADQDWTRVDEIHGLIKGTTSAARQLRREIRQHLPRGLLLAIPRPDVLELLDIQERITDTTRDIARPIALRGMGFPPALNKIIGRHCSLISGASNQALTAIRELDEMIETGFGGRERKTVEKMLVTLDRLVQRCDAQHERLFRQLCRSEDTLPPLDVMFYYQIAAALDSLASACGEIGEQLRLLLAQ